MSYDELELDRMGDRRTATFFCISDTDSTYNFLVALAFSQMFNLYSLGMKQKLGLAQAIMEGQDILILDEPFNALDYKTYNDVKEIIRTLQAEGKTILMTSHNYEDIETLCDEVYVLEDGKLGTLPADEMKRRFRG